MLSNIVESELNKTFFFKRYFEKSLALTIKQKTPNDIKTEYAHIFVLFFNAELFLFTLGDDY